MIDPAMRKSVWILFEKGENVKQLSKKFHMDKKTIKKIIELKGEIPEIKSSRKIEIDKELILKLYDYCDGWTPRIHEILKEEYQKEIGYSTLTAMIREMNIGDDDTRSHQVPDQPGEEFQHDTSPYTVKLGSKSVKVQASSLYFRYSKIRYLKFYPTFTKFHLRCFFHEALSFWGYTAKICIVDNTNLVKKKGTGRNATFHDDMNMFAKMYGFDWQAHEVNHSDRKGGVEKSLHFVETNFLPGRTFASLEDMNHQALEWCQNKSRRPHSETKLIPVEVFELEKPYLKKIPIFTRPYFVHERSIDQYGFIAFNANYFWIPKGYKDSVQVFEYSDEIEIYQKRKKLISYHLPPWGAKGQKLTPPGVNLEYVPKKNTIDTSMEESTILAFGEKYKDYIRNAKKHHGHRNKQYQFLRGLYSFYKNTNLELFEKVMDRAMTYRVYDIEIIMNIRRLILMNDGIPSCEIEDIEIDLEIIEGHFSDEPDLNQYHYSGDLHE